MPRHYLVINEVAIADVVLDRVHQAKSVENFSKSGENVAKCAEKTHDPGAS
ncbi:MAG TPA: hypothetical protein VN688_25440 [Gemmataceae bacterium]|nr:hypothetical protein [Gemmataceae bacterium]